jgi:hypothetical protein
MNRLLPVLAASVAVASAAPFTIEKMPNPPGVDPQVGGLAVLPDGKVATAFHRGEVMVFDPTAKTWSTFAEGLQEPLGLLAESPTSLLVMQRAELTRLRDTDGDGRADDYETVFDDFGMSGNYHEFAFGPAKGPDGRLYIGLNIASNGAGVRPEIRGAWSEIGELDRAGMTHDADWGKRAGKAGRMYSRVPWRGWILAISPDGKSMEPFASGLRSPDGLGFDADGNLLVTDNQGDWRGTSPLHVIQRGGFHGHPASLVWQKGWDRGDPLKLPVAELDRMRVKESARFPQGDLANSPTEPVLIPASWGPFAGQVLIGEMNQPRLVRFLADDIAGFRQGTLVPMFDGTSLGNGNHRLAFGPDGTLWVGKTHLSWAGAEGLVKVTPNDIGRHFAVTAVKLAKSGDRHVLAITLSQPADPKSVAPKVDRFGFRYHKEYGSPKTDQAVVETGAPALSADGKRIEIPLTATAGLIHRIDLAGLRSADGAPLDGKLLYYQATRLP